MEQDVTQEAHALLERARELAQQAKSWECVPCHVLWACVEHEPGEEARKLRSACQNAPWARVRPPEHLPQFNAELVQLIASSSDLLDRAGLFAKVCAAELPERVRRRLDDWRTPAAPPAEPDKATEHEPTVSWQRLVLDDGYSIRVVELTRVAATIFARVTELDARTRRQRGDTKIEIKTLASEANAIRSLKRRIDNALNKEHVLEEPVQLPLPTESTSDVRRRARDARNAVRQQRLARFVDDAVAFFEAWEQRGYDPARTFHQEAQTRLEAGDEKANWNTIAGACVALAAAQFGVAFSYRTIVDEEHGTTGPLHERHFAQFYESPKRVARMALEKMRDFRSSIDGDFPSWKPSSAVPHEPDDEVSLAMTRFRAQS